ncbi:hypothetical protein ESD82_14320 [Paracoccus pantotrophus]|uniref:Uncharacterized protein n=1 Tax=Paracoccus pantotrophus TaxID=82367 RepID=A0AAE6NYH0_PARPN|nr:hypothetical protein [Paracoccus pantotrophus]QFG37327.1 hypothetical protein ESD82_14320 [Paracoccus pantotrophus]
MIDRFGRAYPAPGGVLAVRMSGDLDQPVHRMLERLDRDPSLIDRLAGARAVRSMLTVPGRMHVC